MNRTRWLITIALGLVPMLASMAVHPGSVVNFSVAASSSSTPNAGGKSGGGKSSANSSSTNSSNSSSSTPSSSSSSSSAVSVGISPKAKVTNPHGPLATPCANCHSYTSWKPIRSNPEFNHDLTGYPLRGMHQNVGCSKCHTSMVFKNVSSGCADCHADIHRRQFGANCANCHSVKGWQTSLQAIQNHQNRFPLVGAHALVQCEECHKQAAVGQFVGLSTSCYSCHQKDFLTPVLDHVGLGLPNTCESCHSMDSWFNAKFDHLKYTGYPLSGAHATLPCVACHINNVFKGTPAQCYSCHTADFINSNNPPHVKLGLPRDCAICHTTLDWSNAKFDHALYAHYPLTGKHAAVPCAQCHTNNNYNSTPTACVACHQADFNGTTNPNHVTAGFPTDCSLCHTTSGWTTSAFNHNATKFPLTGVHAGLSCAQCHVNNNYSGTLPTYCAGCHQTDWDNTNAPPHKALASLFPASSCSTCHTTAGWTGAPFDHNKTNFPLTGTHTTVTCIQCHVGNDYLTRPTDCVGCHQTDYNNTTSPNHAAAHYPTTCATCHNTTSWATSNFDHSKTGFPLTGAHITVSCALCHVNNNYNLTAANTACAACHQTDWNNTNAPPHKTLASLFPASSCSTCHTTAGWTGATFDHNKTTFPLTGTHTTVTCIQCHVGNDYLTRPTDCVGCHQTDYNNTTSPNHAAAHYPTTCATCHNTTSWATSNFDHSKTGFPLTGAHITVSCALCHVNNNYNLTAANTACAACHQTDWDNTNAPPHKALASLFPTTSCSTCHTTAGWTGAPFDHNKTKFPLTGAHTSVTCVQCHVGNDYLTRPTDCVGCHQTDYNNTTNPNHAAAHYPTTCTTCHNTTSWLGSNFDHSQTGFPLTGAHVSVTCALCHVNNNYSLTAANAVCSACHMTDWNNTNAPPHQALASLFPATACATCHTTTDWTGGKFDHSKTTFPLTGTHVTTTCIQCHVGNDYLNRPTDCIGCHQTDYNNTTNPNHAASHYPTTCATCHNTINWATSNFDHNKTGFPLTGAHVTVTCALCHVNNNYSLTAANAVCSACHMTDYNGTNSPPHAALASTFPASACATCHTTSAWTGAPFNHSATGFPLVGAHTALTCVQCHTSNNYSLAAANTTCIACHQTDFTNANNPPHSGFPTDCTTCHGAAPLLWTTATFNHGGPPANFPLVGAHTALQCVQCHVNNNYSLTAANTTCIACHQTDFNNANNPPHAGFPTNCTTCHGAAPLLWTTATFNHGGPPANFPLVGAHTALQCVQCHVNNNYSLTVANTTCIACHQTDFNNANNPPHAGFPTNCTTCHGAAPLLWTTATFNHGGPPANFPLVGAHTALQCVQCHVNNNYSLTVANTTCIACHQTDFNNANNPPHTSFPTNCTTCHGAAPLTWTTATFNHTSTGFALVGAHTALQCVQCHVNNNYNLTAANTTCISCHQTDFNGANNPPHTSFPTDCTTCHGAAPLLWTTATFNHTSTGFALVGAHTALTCVQCHVNNNYNLTAANTTCISCHQTDFNNANNPSHAGFPTDCTTCHGAAPLLWTTATFNHSGPPANFPLVGFHATLTCVQCHINNNYNLTAANTTCISCHQADYTGTTNPSHAAAAFPTTCDTCHNNTAWNPIATFNHTLYANYQLTGAHASLTCVQCHTTNNFVNLGTTCITCHLTDFNGATSPQPHAGFPTDCSICHNTTAWTSATFNHTSFGFALTGAHIALTCIQCHVGNNYSLTAANALCSACHMADYNGTTSPPHASSGFPTTCDVCHSTTNWTGATFNHNNTTFPLTGAHTTVACALCHTNNNYSGTLPTDCYSCHTKDYTGTTNPNHATAGWPTTCTTCHTTTAWLPATLASSYHTFFPLNHGNANGVCTTCHTNSSDYSVFTCTGCHGGNNAANFHHPNVNGYVYNSVNCYACHKSGGGG